MKRKFHAPFCSGGRGREAPAYHNLGALLICVNQCSVPTAVGTLPHRYRSASIALEWREKAAIIRAAVNGDSFGALGRCDPVLLDESFYGLDRCPDEGTQVHPLCVLFRRQRRQLLVSYH